jgi:hypothetical protein
MLRIKRKNGFGGRESLKKLVTVNDVNITYNEENDEITFKKKDVK